MFMSGSRYARRMIDDGLNLDNIEETSQQEIDTYLQQMWRHRGMLYEMTANSVWLDTRPDFAKLHRRGARLFGRIDGKLDPTRGPMTGLGLLFDYICLGWEVGILNQIDSLRFRNRDGRSSATDRRSWRSKNRRTGNRRPRR